MKKKSLIILSLVTATALLAGCITVPATEPKPEVESQVVSETESGGESQIANPWTDTTLEAIEDELGIEIHLPKEVTQSGCRMLSDEKIYEVDFVYQDQGYTYRLKKTDALEDISGLFYEWSGSMETPVGDYMATDYRSISDEETVDHIIWYDEKEGITHSLSTIASDLDGFDISPVAEKLIGIGDDNFLDYSAFYAPVIEEILGMIEDGYDYEKEYQYCSNGIMERVNYGKKDELLKSIGYKIEDISGDAIPELLIGEDQNNGEEKEPESYLFSVFTCKDGEIYCTLDGWARSSYRYLGEGSFFYLGSGGAMYTTIAECHLSHDGSEIIFDDCYFTYDKNGGNEMGYYHNTTGVVDPKEAEELDISPEEFWEIEEDNEYKNITWTPVGEFK